MQALSMHHAADPLSRASSGIDATMLPQSKLFQPGLDPSTWGPLSEMQPGCDGCPSDVDFGVDFAAADIALLEKQHQHVRAMGTAGLPSVLGNLMEQSDLSEVNINSNMNMNRMDYAVAADADPNMCWAQLAPIAPAMPASAASLGFGALPSLRLRGPAAGVHRGQHSQSHSPMHQHQQAAAAPFRPQGGVSLHAMRLANEFWCT